MRLRILNFEFRFVQFKELRRHFQIHKSNLEAIATGFSISSWAIKPLDPNQTDRPFRRSGGQDSNWTKNNSTKKAPDGAFFFVVWGGIEPPTHRFSVYCSTD
jgi:hypothetical protein